MMFLATLQLGKTGFFTEHGWFYLELLVLLFSIGAGVLWLIEKARHRGEKAITGHNPMGSIPTHLLQTKAGRIGKTLGVLVLGGVLGWNWRSYQYDRARIIYQQEHDAWKQKDAEYDKNHASFQQAVAAWKAKQKENR